MYLNRARVIGSLAFIPVAITLYNVEAILLWLEQDPDTARYASQYTRQMIPAIYVINLCDMQEKFLVYMQYPTVVAVSQAMTTAVHAPLCYYFVEVRECGIVGLSYSIIIAFSAQFAFLLIFASCQKEIAPAV